MTTTRTVGETRALTRNHFVGLLVDELSARFAQWVVTPQQTEAWKIGFGWIWDACQTLPAQADAWLLMPEYTPPLSPVRPDLLVVTGSHALVVEMKTGQGAVTNAAYRQLDGYVSGIWNSIRAARETTLVSILLTLGGPATSSAALPSWSPEEGHPVHLGPSGLAEALLRLSSVPPVAIDVEAWTRPTYDVHPSIVEAATSLIAQTEDHAVLTHMTEDEELDRVRDHIVQLIDGARDAGERLVVLLTGVPGSGKTLVGLRLAHDPGLQASLPSGSGTPLYLTGNGPLVDVLVEAISRDYVIRFPTATKKQSAAIARSKVKLVHAVTTSALPINGHVVVFDEGQRIWTAAQMVVKHGAEHIGSEAESILMTLEDRDWAVLVVLIGGGQEINRGEAGPETWLEAIDRRSLAGHKWRAVSSPEVLGQKSSNVSVDPDLHLTVSRRAQSAAALSDWVNLLLDLRLAEAAALRKSDFPSFPIVMTRDLGAARDWLVEQANSLLEDEPRPTIGLFASSKSARLRAHGLEVGSQPRGEVSWPAWFLDRRPSLHASEMLEVAATEFKCQGLELDYAGVAWSWDMIPAGSESWQARRVNKSKAKWQAAGKADTFFRNAYRVLLTRCRRGMVIWVPKGDQEDPSRSPEEMDLVWAALQSAGVEPMSL